MADNFAIGKALQIPDSILKNVDALDKKISNIAKNAKIMAESFNSAFSGMNNSAKGFNDKLKIMQDVLSKLSNVNNANGLSYVKKGLGEAATQAEKTSNSMAKAASSINQFARPEISATIKSMQEQLRKLAEDIRMYYQSIGTGKKTYIDFGQAGLKEAIPQFESLLRAVNALANAQARLQQSGGMFKNYLDNLNGTSLAAQRQADAMKKLNDYYRQEEKASAQAAAAAEKARQKEALAAERAAAREAAAAEKAAAAAEKAAQRKAAAQAKLDSRLRKSNYQSYITSTEGALRTADKASNYTQRTQAIRNINAALNNLRTTDANYQKDLERLKNAYNRLTAEQNNFNRNLGRVQQNMSNAMNISEQLRRRIALIFSVSQITSFLTAIRDVTGEFEIQNSALRSILGNINQADVLYQQVQDLAVKSPFTVKELTTYTKSLAAYGLEYDKLYDTLKRLADISSGLGVDMQRIILAYGQVQAANVLRGTETRQFSEAGLNILKELAKYYSEVEQRAVSLAEVQDRQFRKMISAEDVTKVIQRITDAGGMFYQMQERQSETIAGMMSNLEDTRDLMYKAIGDENRDTIVALINSMRTLMENWRIFANLVKAGAAAMALYTIKTAVAAAMNGKFTTSSLQAAAAQKGFNGTLASGALAIKNFAKFSVNPWVLAVTGITTAALMIDSHRKAVERVREEYDTLTKSLEDNKTQFDELAAKINDSNKRIVKANSNLNGQKQGTDAYQKAQLELNRAMSEQSGYLDELHSKYPELYKQIVHNTDGTINLAKAQEMLNQSIRDIQLVNYYAKDTEKFFSDGLKTNLMDLQDALNNTSSKARDADAAITTMLATARETLALNRSFINEAEYTKVSKEIDDIANSTENAYQKFKKLDAIRFKQGGEISFFKFNRRDIEAANELRDAFIEEREQYNALGEDVAKVAENMRSSFNLTSEEGQKRAAEAAAGWIRSLEGVDDRARDLAAKQFTIHLGINVSWRQADDDLNKLFNDWRDQIAGLDDTGVFKNTLKNISSIKDFNDDLTKSYADIKKQLEANNNALSAGNILTEDSKKQIRETNVQLEAQKKDIEEAASALGLSLTTEKERNKAARDSAKLQKEAIEDFKNRIKLLKEAGEEYEKLREYNTKEVSTAKVKEMFRGTGIDNVIKSMMGFEPEDLLKGYDMFIQEAKRLGKEATKALQDEQRPIIREIDVKVKKSSLDETAKEIEKAFAEYDLSKELLSSGLDESEISAVFKTQITSLKELVDYISNTIRPKLERQGLEQEKLWEDTNKKITELQADELEEQTKQYVKYLQNQYTESTKIILKLQSDIKKVQTNPNFTETMKKSIIDNLQKEAQSAQKKIRWESFTGSDYYIDMFKNLEYVSSSALEIMRKKIESVKYASKGLPASDIKEMVDALSEIESEQISRNPFKAMSDGIKELVKNMGQRRDLEKEITDLILQQDVSMSMLEDAELAVEQARKKYYDTISKYGKGSEQATAAKIEVDINETAYHALKSNLDDISLAIGNVKEKQDDLSKSRKKVIEGLSNASEAVSNLANSFSTLKVGMESVFNLSDAASDTMDSLIDFGNNLASTFNSAKTLAEGITMKDPLQIANGAISTLGGVFSTIGSIFSIGDKKRERQIKKEQELIENLQKQYEKLAEDIENAYSINTFRSAEKNAEYNLRQQIESLQNQIAAEEDKKKTDDDRIKEWKNQIKDLEDELENLEAQRLSALGGFGSDENIKSAAQEFVDVWLDAYKETGDGLDALYDKWDEYIQKILNAKLMYAVTDKYIKPITDYIDSALADYDWSADDQKTLQEYIDQYVPLLNKALGDIVGNLGVSIGGGDSLTGLQESIQGITADQADALAAIVESIRYFVADSNTLFRQFLESYQNAMNIASNPILAELQAQTALIQAINTSLGSVIKNVPSNGKALKVQIV